MLDTTPITDTIRHLISTGTTERDLLAAVARKFPELTLTEFVAAPRDASGGAEGSTATLRRRQASASVPHDRSTPNTRPNSMLAEVASYVRQPDVSNCEKLDKLRRSCAAGRRWPSISSGLPDIVAR